MRRVLFGALLAVAVLAGVIPSSAEGAALPPVCETVRDGVLVAVTGEDGEVIEGCPVSGAVYSVGEKTFEPTVGAAPDGSLYFATTPGSGVAVGFGAGIARSTDGGATWSDVSPTIAGRRVPLETNDPYIYVDPGTGRIFNFHMSPILTCSTLSFSDDAGTTWTTNPAGCGPTGAWDHQTMVAAAPRALPTNGYPNVLHQCVNAVYAEMCSRSLDGGLTWSPSTVAWPNDKAGPGLLCGTQTGHLQAAPDGTVYLPTSDCATFPTVAVSRDDGLTWERVKVADIAMPFEDPAVAVDASGNVYVAFPDKLGQLWFSVSRDGGRTYSTPVKAASAQVDSAKLAMTVGDDGKVAIAHVATGGIPGQEGGKRDLEDPWQVRWGAFLTTSLDALSDSPTFTTLEVTGTDPLFNNANACGPGLRCPYIIDFIEATVTPDGRPYGAFVDGCTEECATTPGARNNVSGTTGIGLVATVDVDLCADRCPRLGAADAVAPSSAVPGTADPAAAVAPTLPGLDAALVEQLRAQATRERLDLATGGPARPR